MNTSHPSGIDRRGFLTTCAAGVGALASLGTGCASLATRPVTTVNGMIRLSIADFPELARPLGAIKILPDGERDPLLVLAHTTDRFSVVSTICTHRGCTVDAQGDQLICPCHGSTYDRAGAVLRGPAEQPLRRYAARVTGGYLEIQLRTPG